MEIIGMQKSDAFIKEMWPEAHRRPTAVETHSPAETNSC